jgi:hypothetical protein
MTEEQFTREKLYQATLSIARAMLRTGLITISELAKIETTMQEKYRPLIGGLKPKNLDFTAL